VNSIERDDLKDLPNTFFYKSFVKQYVETVGLDYQPLRARVEELVALEEPPAVPRAESPMDRLRTSLELACSKLAHLKTLLLRPEKIGGLAPHRNL
jgi:cytoskeletal protein RodZ